MKVFADGFFSAELDVGLAAGFGGRHSGADILFGQKGEMLLHLLLEPGIAAAGGGEVANAGEEAIQGSHARSSALTSKNRAMMAVFCSQFCFSAARSCCPARVRR